MVLSFPSINKSADFVTHTTRRSSLGLLVKSTFYPEPYRLREMLYSLHISLGSEPGKFSRYLCRSAAVLGDSLGWLSTYAFHKRRSLSYPFALWLQLSADSVRVDR